MGGIQYMELHLKTWKHNSCWFVTYVRQNSIMGLIDTDYSEKSRPYKKMLTDGANAKIALWDPPAPFSVNGENWPKMIILG